MADREYIGVFSKNPTVDLLALGAVAAGYIVLSVADYVVTSSLNTIKKVIPRKSRTLEQRNLEHITGYAKN